MQDTPKSLSDHLIQEGTRVIEFFNHLDPEQWEVIVYPGQSPWDFHHLLAHFVSAETGRRELIENVCSGGMGAPDDFEIDRFNQSEVERLAKLPESELLARFIVERRCLAEFVSRLSLEDLSKIGNDPFLGKVAVSEVIKLTYRHLQIHIREVRHLVG